LLGIRIYYVVNQIADLLITGHFACGAVIATSEVRSMPTAAQTFSALTPRVIAAIALVAIMLQMGLALEPVTARAIKRRERWLALRALAFNFALVPFIALLAKHATGAVGPGAVALLLLAATPGGRHAPAITQAARGDAALSVEITLFTNKLNVILSPLLAASLVGRHRVGLPELPYVVQTVVLQLGPFFVAKRIRKWRPKLAVRLARPAEYAGNAATVVLLVYLTARHALSGILSFGARGWLAVLIFGAVLLVLGWLVGGRDPATRRTFAIAGVARNLALALVIANMIVRDDQVLLAIFGAWVILLGLGWFVVALARLRKLPAGIPLSGHHPS
jgi:predicted Na+-dependent transporter